MKKKLTYSDIIDETVEYYCTHPRSLNYEDICRYIGPDNERCAFSRCCTEDSKFQEGELAVHQRNAKFLPQYAHITDINFWNNLQKLHDSSDNWKTLRGEELTEKGLEYVKNFKEQFPDA